MLTYTHPALLERSLSTQRPQPLGTKRTRVVAPKTKKKFQTCAYIPFPAPRAGVNTRSEHLRVCLAVARCVWAACGSNAAVWFVASSSDHNHRTPPLSTCRGVWLRNCKVFASKHPHQHHVIDELSAEGLQNQPDGFYLLERIRVRDSPSTTVRAFLGAFRGMHKA